MPNGFRIAALLTAYCALAAGESGTTPKPKPELYPVRAEAEGITIAAEYMLHTIASDKQSFVVPDYLVIELAVYPNKGVRPAISAGSFTLRMNGKSGELFPQTPGIVSASLKYSDWENPRGLEVGAGPVILGRRRPVGRFPGDRRADEGYPQPRVETRQSTDYGDRKLTAPEAVIEWALPEGEAGGPVSGFLYYAFKGKPKSIRSLELIYRQGSSQIPLRLF